MTLVCIHLEFVVVAVLVAVLLAVCWWVGRRLPVAYMLAVCWWRCGLLWSQTLARAATGAESHRHPGGSSAATGASVTGADSQSSSARQPQAQGSTASGAAYTELVEY